MLVPQLLSRKVCNATALTTVSDRTVVEFEHATRRDSIEVMRGVPTLKMAALN
jgi:hypothetical protein